MKKALLTIVLIFFVASGYAQEMRMEKGILSGINSVRSPEFGSDILMSAFEPIGPISSIKAADGTIYVAINDTLSTSNLGLVILKSTNNGDTWSTYNFGLTARAKYEKVKMISSGAGPDSLYIFTQVGNTVYSWNFLNLTLNTVNPSTSYRTFDVVGASTGALYIFVDMLDNTTIYRLPSVNGGFTWGTQQTLSTSGALPTLSISPGDTIAVTYFSTLTVGGPDTTSAVIKLSRYRQLANGTIAVISLGTSTPSDLATESLPKNEYMTALGNGTLWFLYTVGSTGNINIKGRCSRDGGKTYSDTLLIAANPNVDEYWFDLKYNKSLTGGFDFIYYSDSLQSGTPTNNTDKIIYRYANYIDSTNFGTPSQVSQHAPLWSAANYKPIVTPLTNDAGVMWVGLDGTSRKLYWDRYNAITSIGNNETPVNYNLSQNYPNPFNPSTKINFSIPKNGFVTMKVYNILGKEVANLVNGNYNAGSYSVDFNASKLSCGVYFYTLEVNGFKETKRMLMIK